MTRKMKLLIKVAEAAVAWVLIYLGLWVVTGKWGFGISDEIWRVLILILLLIMARTSAYIYGKWEAGQEK